MTIRGLALKREKCNKITVKSVVTNSRTGPKLLSALCRSTKGDEMNKRSIINWCIVPLLVLMLAGCSGSSESRSPTISGIAAAGSTLTGTVYLKDSSIPARELSVPIAADGSFSFDLNGLTAPFILKATGTANGSNLTLYSFATAAGVANINPLSNLAVVLANGSDDLATLYNSPDAVKMHAILNALPNAITNVQAALQPTLAKFGAATVNFIKPHKTPSCGRGQRQLALPVSCPSATPRLELSPQFKLKGAAYEQVSKAISCDMALSISHCVGTEVSLSGIAWSGCRGSV